MANIGDSSVSPKIITHFGLFWLKNYHSAVRLDILLCAVIFALNIFFLTFPISKYDTTLFCFWFSVDLVFFTLAYSISTFRRKNRHFVLRGYIGVIADPYSFKCINNLCALYCDKLTKTSSTLDLTSCSL